jgi:hypothetical protein
MSFLPGEGNTSPRIHAELDHLAAVVQEEFAESGCLLALGPRADREIECYD